MNRSAFHKRLARATVAVGLTIAVIGCATAPEYAPTPQTTPTEASSQAIGHLAPDPAQELADISLQSPIANPPEAVSASLAEPSPVWIDDTLARRTPWQQTELAVQPPPPEIDAPAAVAEATASPPADDPDRDAPYAPQPAPREPRTDSPSADSAPETAAADRTADRSLALIEPRVPSSQRLASPGGASTARASASPDSARASDSDSPPPVGVADSSPSPSPAPTTAPMGSTRSIETTPAARDAASTISRSSGDPTPSHTPPAAAGPVANRPTTLWNERAAAVASGSEFSVVLPGSGWLYVGKEYGDGEIRMLGKSRSGTDEVFRFRIGEAGEYGLWFQQQDSLSGSLVNERLAVRAATEEEATSITLATLAEGSSLASSTTAASSVTGDDATTRAEQGASVGDIADVVGPSDRAALDRAFELLDEGESSHALAAFVDGTERGSIDVEALEDDVLERFAAVARSPFNGDTGRPAVIRSFWRRVASSGSAAAPEARRALFEIAARAGEAGEISAAVSALEAAGEASADDMTRSAEALLGAGRESDALPLLGRALSRGGAALESVGHLEDDRLFALARFLEQPGPDRDLRSAASLYRLILDDRPLSRHWDDSRSRLEYLRRHYFEVR